MTVLQVLSKMICSVKLFGCIALTKLVHIGKVVDSLLPIPWMICEFFTTEAAGVGRQASQVGK